MIIPFLEFSAGNCQDAPTLVEEVALTMKLDGGCEGTTIGQCFDQYTHFQKKLLLLDVKSSLVNSYLLLLDFESFNTVNNGYLFLWLPNQLLICDIPSSIVLSTSTELFGPSPSEVKART